MAAQRYQMPQNSNFGAYLEEINVTDFDIRMDSSRTRTWGIR